MVTVEQAPTLTPNTTCINTAGDIAGATASGLAKPSCDAFASPALLAASQLINRRRE